MVFQKGCIDLKTVHCTLVFFGLIKEYLIIIQGFIGAHQLCLFVPECLSICPCQHDSKLLKHLLYGLTICNGFDNTFFLLFFHLFYLLFSLSFSLSLL